MKILVPIDFSTYSFNAIELAKVIQPPSQGEITLLHVIEPPDDDEQSSEMELVKRQAEERMNEMTTLSDIGKVVMTGDPYEVIREMATNADLMIIGESGMSDDKSFFMGSLADNLVRSASCAVLTVNELVEWPLKNIVYATDLEEDHPALMEMLKKFQAWFHGKLHLVKINTRDQYMNDMDALPLLHAWKERYELTDCEVHVYNHEDEELGIVYFAEQVHADLIALGVHQKSRFQQVVTGGTAAQEVSDHTRRPVLTMLFEEE